MRTLWKLVTVPGLAYTNTVICLSVGTRKFLKRCHRNVGRAFVKGGHGRMSLLSLPTPRATHESLVFTLVSSQFLRHFATVLYRTSRMEARITSASSSLLPPSTSTAAACRQTLLRCMSHYGCTRGLARLMESRGTILQEQERARQLVQESKSRTPLCIKASLAPLPGEPKRIRPEQHACLPTRT